MNTKNYGDVLLDPERRSPPTSCPTFFEPLGTVDELKDKYRFVRTEQTLDGKVYGLAITGNANGFVYNKKVWQQAGITDAADDAGRVPRRPEGHQGQDRRRSRCTPTTRTAGRSASGRASAARSAATPTRSTKLGHDDAPWAPGKEHYHHRLAAATTRCTGS